MTTGGRWCASDVKVSVHFVVLVATVDAACVRCA